MGMIFNRKDQNEKRRVLRNNMTHAEIILWNCLKGRKLGNLKFRRQFSVGKYVIDFICPEIKLAIEVDGDIHEVEDNIEYDIKRQNEIENFGINFLRIRNEEIFRSIEDVILKIEKRVNELKR